MSPPIDFRKIGNRLSSKIILPVASLALMGLLTGSLYTRSSYLERAQEANGRELRLVMSGLISSLQLLADSNQISRLIAAYAASPGVEQILLLQPEAPYLIVFASERALIGRELDLQEHFRGMAGKMNLLGLNTYEVGERDMRVGISPISLAGLSTVRSVVSPEYKLLVYLNAAKLNSKIAKEVLKSFVFSLCAIFILLGFSFILLRRFVLLPIADIVRVIHKRQAGSAIDYPASFSNDEIGQTATALRDLFDVTEDIKKGLKEAREQAEVGTRSKSQFLANMSHEIRTPLNGVLGMTLLMMESGLDAEQQKKMRLIHSSGQLLLQVVNDILDFSKIEAGMLVVENTVFSIEELAQESIAMFSGLAAEKGLNLYYTQDISVPMMIVSDVVRLKQILLNLISNAIKFSSPGSIFVSCSAQNIAENYELLFAVKDSGLGMTPEQQGRLFKAFSQADGSTTRRFGGTGLGLAICFELTKKLGGTIWVESKENEGSTFFFKIVASPAPENTISDSLVTKEAGNVVFLPTEEAPKMALKILLAEDNFVNQQVTIGILQRLGYKAELADNGLEVLKRLETEKYDLILMDFHMPVMDGYSTTQEILGKYGDASPVIVALTASTMQADRDRASSCGMTGFLCKPIVVSELRLLLANLKKP